MNTQQAEKYPDELKKSVSDIDRGLCNTARELNLYERLSEFSSKMSFVSSEMAKKSEAAKTLLESLPRNLTEKQQVSIRYIINF